MSVTKKGLLIVFSGLPATGKTSLASKLAAHLGATYLRVDAILLGIKDDAKNPDMPAKCFRAAQFLALENLRLGNVVISDSVNADMKIREDWNTTSESAEAKIIHVEVLCSNKEEHKKRLETRTTTLNGLKEPSWQEIQELEYQAWSHERIRLDTCGNTVEASFEELLSLLKSKLQF